MTKGLAGLAQIAAKRCKTRQAKSKLLPFYYFWRPRFAAFCRVLPSDEFHFGRRGTELSPQPQWSRLSTGEIASFRLNSALTKLPPQAVIRSSSAETAKNAASCGIRGHRVQVIRILFICHGSIRTQIL